MAHHHYHHTTKTEDGAHLSVEHGTGVGTRLTLYVDSLVVERDVSQSLYMILSVVVDNAVFSCDGDGQATFVILESTAQFTVFR